MRYEEMLDLWRSKLYEGRAQHSAAVEKYRQVSSDYEKGLFTPLDGWVALQQAHRDDHNDTLQFVIPNIRIVGTVDEPEISV
jgi:hypothetical protein